MSDEKQLHPLIEGLCKVVNNWPVGRGEMEVAQTIANYIVAQENNARPPVKASVIEEFQSRITLLQAENDRLRGSIRLACDVAINPPKLMLPPIASKWHGGFYVGIVRGLYVDHHLIQLRANAPNQYCGWGAASRMAVIEGRLPTPNEASLLYANGMLEGEKNLVWTSTAAGHNHAMAINPQNGEISSVNKTLSLAWTSVKTVQV